jgi:hypothetical protein
MFACAKKPCKYQYLQLVENSKEKGRVTQQGIATLGRKDELSAKGRLQTLIHSSLILHSGSESKLSALSKFWRLPALARRYIATRSFYLGTSMPDTITVPSFDASIMSIQKSGSSQCSLPTTFCNHLIKVGIVVDRPHN